MSGQYYSYTAVTPTESYSAIAAAEAYRIQQAQAEAARRAQAEAARREAERRARIEAQRKQAREQLMTATAQRYHAANPTLITPTLDAARAQAADAENASRQANEARLQQELAQRRAANEQRHLAEMARIKQRFADQQQQATATAAWSALEDAKTLAVEAQMWIAAGAPGQPLQVESLTAQMRDIEAAIIALPDEGRKQADKLESQLRARRDELAQAHFRRWSDLLGDCGFERGRVRGLLARLNENQPDAKDQRVATLLGRLTAAEKTLGAVVDRDQEYTLNLDDVSTLLGDATSHYDELAEMTFDLIAETQQRRTAATIAEALGALGYRKQDGSLPQVARTGDRLDVIALRQNPSSKVPDQKMVSFFVGADGSVKGDFSGYADRECEAAASEVFAELRRRGVALVDKDAAVRLRQADPSTLSTNPQDYAAYAPKLDYSKRQPELRRRVLKALQRMGFGEHEIQEKVEGGTIIIGASHGPVAYRVVLTPTSGAQDSIPPAVAGEMESGEDMPPTSEPPTRTPDWRRARGGQQLRA